MIAFLFDVLHIGKSFKKQSKDICRERYFTCLPNEVISKIFSFLPAESAYGPPSIACYQFYHNFKPLRDRVAFLQAECKNIEKLITQSFYEHTFFKYVSARYQQRGQIYHIKYHQEEETKFSIVTIQNSNEGPGVQEAKKNALAIKFPRTEFVLEEKFICFKGTYHDTIRSGKVKLIKVQELRPELQIIALKIQKAINAAR